MNKKITLSILAVGLLIVCSVVIGICLVIATQAYQNGEHYLVLAWLGVSMIGLLKVIISASIKADRNNENV